VACTSSSLDPARATPGDGLWRASKTTEAPLRAWSSAPLSAAAALIARLVAEGAPSGDESRIVGPASEVTSTMRLPVSVAAEAKKRSR
jgi:hypothetical protein